MGVTKELHITQAVNSDLSNNIYVLMFPIDLLENSYETQAIKSPLAKPTSQR